jgi:hypothetical protein
MMLSEMQGLEELVIDRNLGPLCCAALVFQELKKLTKLRVLHLQCSDAGKILFTMRKMAGNERMADLWPKLEELRFTSLELDADFEELPNSLVRLNLDGCVVIAPTLKNLDRLESLETEIVRPEFVLPNSLTSLIVHTPFDFANRPLPAQLVTFCGVVHSPQEIDFGFKLPLTLENLALKGSFYFPEVSYRHLSRLKALKLCPTTEETMRSRRNHNPFFLLPPSLTTLEIYGDLFPALPSGLGTLQVICQQPKPWRTAIPCDVPVASTAAEWQLSQMPSLETYSRTGLPTTLTSLSIQAGDIDFRLNFSFVADLPSASLTSLNASTMCITKEQSKLLLTCPNLKYLELGLDCNFLPPVLVEAPRIVQANIHLMRSLEPTALEQLPRSLTSLMMYGHHDREVAISDPFHHLPIAMRYFECYNIDIEIGKRDLMELAKLESLETLHVSFSLDRSIQDSDIALLPRSLIKLEVTGYMHLTGECFRNLPPQLETLTFFRFSKWTNSAVQFLPRSLRYIYVPNSSRLTYECVPNLPPRLMVSDIFESDEWRVWTGNPLLEHLPDLRISAGNPMPLVQDIYAKQKKDSCVIS